MAISFANTLLIIHWLSTPKYVNMPGGNVKEKSIDLNGPVRIGVKGMWGVITSEAHKHSFYEGHT